MANNLTGDFDVAVQMTLPRINRLLAAQHQAGVFPHSFTVRIDDRPTSVISPDTIVDIPAPGPDLPVEPPVPVPPGPGPGPARVPAPPRPAVLRRAVFTGARVPPDALPTGEEPATAAFLGPRAFVWAANAATHITRVQATAEVQASTPTVTLPWGATSRVTLHFDARAHVTIDPGSTYIPEFVHGDVALTVDASQLGVQRGNQFVLDFDFLANNLEVTFAPLGSPQPVATIENAIYSLMASGFVCGSAVAEVPPEIRSMQLKPLQGARPAVALLLNLSGHASNPGSVQTVFVNDTDDFAIAVGRDYIQATVTALAAAAQATLDAATGGTWEISPAWGLTLTLSSPTVSVDLEDKLLRVRVGIHVHSNIIPPPPVPQDFDVTVSQAFTLSLVNNVIQVASAGDLDPDIEPDFPGDSKLEEFLRDQINPYRDMILNAVSTQLQPLLQQLDVAGILRDLQVPSPAARYTAIEVTPEGVILRGRITLGAWQKPVAASDSLVMSRNGKDEVRLNAFASWIPGGTVESYTWKNGSQQSDDHAFMKFVAYSGIGGPGRWCVTVKGTQTTDTGGRVNVRRASCIPYSVLFGPLTQVGPNLDALKRDRHAIVIPRPGPDPVPDAYVDPWAAGLVSPGTRTNLLVHFADGEGPEAVRAVEQALAHGGLERATVGLVLVLPRGQLARALGAASTSERRRGTSLIVTLTEDFEGSWARTFEARRTPATYLVDALGQVRWRHAGPLHPEQLGNALREHAMMGGRPRYHPISVGVAPGDRAPDFRFELAPGHLVPLRRLRRKATTLLFWTSWAEPSLEELRRLEDLDARGDESPLLLAINDGEPVGRAREAFHRHRFRSQLVVDPEREISRAYGIHCWPTTIEIGGHGRIWHVQLGRSHDHEEVAAGTAC